MDTDDSNKDICGIAGCGCWYHAEEGVPCEHDIAEAKRLGIIMQGDCLDDTGVNHEAKG